MTKEDDLQRQIDEVDRIIEAAQRKRRKLRAKLVELRRTARARAKAEFDKTRPPTWMEWQKETGFLTTEQARDKCWDADIGEMSIYGIWQLIRRGVLPTEKYHHRIFIDPRELQKFINDHQKVQEFIDRSRKDN